jgi:hypothetical protein
MIYGRSCLEPSRTTKGVGMFRYVRAGSLKLVSDPLNWYDHKADNPPWIKALAEVRRLAPREGWRYQHVQAIIVSIDQYAEAAFGNRDYFLNRPQSIGGGRKDHVP